ncbi:MAG: acyloxyacyl hydrolase [Proteobacteria bacterium]|nr:acyloxyacyl hydrolase [Pseudomonadota bacterium]
MRSKKDTVAFVLLFIGFLAFPQISLSEDNVNYLEKGTREIGISTGYGFSRDAERYVESVPLNLHWGCVFTDPKGKSFYRGNWEYLVEGSLSYLFHGQRKYSIGATGLIRYNFLAGKRLVPYVQAGAGILHTNLEMHNFPNDFNFSSQAGLGIQYFISKNTAIRGEYRLQHISNAGLYENNTGLNMNNFWIGYAYFF